MGRHQKITRAIIGKDAQLIRLGYHFAAGEMGRESDDASLPPSPKQISEAVRSTIQQAFDCAGELEVLRRCAATDFEKQRAIHEAVYAPALFRPAIYSNSRLLGRHYRQKEVRESGRTDRDCVRAAKADRRRRVEKTVSEELAATHSYDARSARRRIVINELVAIDLKELNARHTVMGNWVEQLILTHSFDERRANYLFEILSPIQAVTLRRISGQLLEGDHINLRSHHEQIRHDYREWEIFRDFVRKHVLRRLLRGEKVSGASLALDCAFAS